MAMQKKLQTRKNSLITKVFFKELPDGPEPCGEDCRLWSEPEDVPARLLQVTKPCKNIERTWKQCIAMEVITNKQ